MDSKRAIIVEEFVLDFERNNDPTMDPLPNVRSMNVCNAMKIKRDPCLAKSQLAPDDDRDSSVKLPGRVTIFYLSIIKIHAIPSKILLENTHKATIFVTKSIPKASPNPNVPNLKGEWVSSLIPNYPPRRDSSILISICCPSIALIISTRHGIKPAHDIEPDKVKKDFGMIWKTIWEHRKYNIYLILEYESESFLLDSTIGILYLFLSSVVQLESGTSIFLDGYDPGQYFSDYHLVCHGMFCLSTCLLAYTRRIVFVCRTVQCFDDEYAEIQSV
jgi:hypothetical protein